MVLVNEHALGIHTLSVHAHINYWAWEEFGGDGGGGGWATA